MKNRIYSVDLNDMLLEAAYPDLFYNIDTEITERSFSADVFLGKGSYKEIFFEGFHIGYGSMELAQHTILHFESEFETVEMHFGLCGDTLTNGNGLKDISFGCNQHNILYTNGFKGNSEWSACRAMEVFEVNLLPSFFEKYLPDSINSFKDFKSSLLAKQTASISKNNLRITPKMHLIIQEIIDCNRVGKFKRMLIEAKVLELLMLQLEQIMAYEGEVYCSIKKSDVEKMYAAKEIILKNMTAPCSLITLAQQVGSNVFTLKKGFKELFGTTVFGFLSEAKMQLAKKMLLEENLTIYEVAERIGYKNPHHFTTAFKKQFGIIPSQLKLKGVFN